MLLMAGLSAVLTLGANSLVAQPAPGGNGGGNRTRGGGPPSADQIAQWRQQRMDDMRKQFDVKDDAEWKALETLITKVSDARMEIGFGGRGFGGGRRTGGADQGGNSAREALQKAVDAKDAGAIKSKLEAYRADVKAKEAKLEKAQEELKAVLTPQQEAVAVLNGLVK